MESPQDANRLRYFTSDFIYIVIKSKIFIKCEAMEFDCQNFRNDWFLNLNVVCVFLVGYYHIWSITNVQRKSVGLEPVINSYQFPVHCGLNIVHVSVGWRSCCIVSKMIKKYLVWRSMHVTDIRKKKYCSQHRSLRNT